MNWNTLVMELRYVKPRELAALMAVMWEHAARYGDEALLQNMQGNSLDPLGAANYMDWGGVPPSAETVQRFGADSARRVSLIVQMPPKA